MKTPIKFFRKQEIKPLTEVGEKKDKRTKFLFTFSKVLFFGSLIFWTGYTTVTYFRNYTWKWQSPIIIKVQTPLVIKHNVEILSPVSSNSASLIGQVFADDKPLNVGAIADKIYQLESSGGKNDGCRKLGLYNGYGFRQNTSEWMCY